MGAAYLANRPWAEWTREERVFCAELYYEARNDAHNFGEWVSSIAGITESDNARTWDVGFEVCFYRDYLWRRNEVSRSKAYSPKRTFDLCLFSEKNIIVIEAKVSEGFEAKQLCDTQRDVDAIPSLLEDDTVRVSLVALTSKQYWSNARSSTKSCFDGHLSWLDLYDRYSNRVFENAEGLYRRNSADNEGYKV
ncbi:hypothetical protein [Aliagarivorans marinus]|uniref:hypothetical protein n=1 Tax=Aliagarivorans marinus TaxID=561965 RepID=UPI0012F8D6BC|nr:hypothetical protein [Aliagarivorans marinus]